MLEKYKETVNRMIDDTTLRMEDSKVILRIMVFLNNPTQRVQNIDLIRKCSVLVKRKISEMNASDVCLVADVSKNFIFISFVFMTCYPLNG